MTAVQVQETLTSGAAPDKRVAGARRTAGLYRVVAVGRISYNWYTAVAVCAVTVFFDNFFI